MIMMATEPTLMAEFGRMIETNIVILK
jgi:hypothetical protein